MCCFLLNKHFWLEFLLSFFSFYGLFAMYCLFAMDIVNFMSLVLVHNRF
jgi:hypothetical protein